MSGERKHVSYADLLRANEEREAAKRARAQPIGQATVEELPRDPTPAQDATIAPAAVPAQDATNALNTTNAPDAGQTPAPRAMVAQPSVEPLQSATNAPAATIAFPATTVQGATIEPIFIEGNHAGYLSLPRVICDGLKRRVTPIEYSVYEHLYRLAYGYRNSPTPGQCEVGFPALSEACHCSERAAVNAVEALEGLGLVKRIGARTRGPRKQRGNRYQVSLPRHSAAPDATIARDTTIAGRATNAAGAHMINKSHKELSYSGSIKDKEGTDPVYEIRLVAARLIELHPKDPAYTNEQLAADVRTALVGQGREVDFELIEEAVRGMRP